MLGLARLAILASLTLLVPACDSTAPEAGSARIYTLAALDGMPLPAVLSGFNGDTIIIEWATLTLDDTHHAVTTTQYQYRYLNYPDTVVNNSIRNSWRQRGDTLEVGYFGRCRDLCPRNELGTLSDPDLFLNSGSPTVSSPVFLYHLTAKY